jgi:homoserine dehydrogenase
MKRVGIVQLGFGTVGGAALEQIAQGQSRWRDTFGIHVTVEAITGRSGAMLAEGELGFTQSELHSIVSGRRRGENLVSAVSPREALAELATRVPVIVMDASAGVGATDLLVDALGVGGGVVLSNKAPLALPTSDARTAALWSQAGPTGRLRYEATCGAGLPVISTLRSLLDSGDEVLSVTGTVSGTFGAIFSSVGAGVPFSRAVVEARAQGYTEPDPRDDLSGLDVARKALILARTMGETIDAEDIVVHSLVPEELRDVSIDEFLARLPEHDPAIGQQAAESLALDTSLKYLMEWQAGQGITVGLRQVPRSTVLGALQGPENIVSFRTRRYDRYPCVVSGPGAGDAVTAAGMIGDMLALATRLAA